MKNFLRSLKAVVQSHPFIERALHTFWQAALGVVVAGAFAAHNSTDIKVLVVAAVAAGASAVKTLVLEGRS